MLPTTVRFGFHTCFGLGCNGCLDLDNPDNAGFEKIYGILNELYDTTEISDVMSRADFWSLASWNAVTHAVSSSFFDFFNPKNETVSPFRYLYGRTDLCPEQNPPKNDLPNPKLGYQEVINKFGKASIHNFTHQEIVPLIFGGHSLGEAKLENSGFEGSWDRSNTTINDAYAMSLSNDIWENKKNKAGNYQFYNKFWEDQKASGNLSAQGYTSLSFNTDVVLVKDLVVEDPATGKLVRNSTYDCSNTWYSKCPDSQLAEFSKFYTQSKSNKKLLIEDFGRVYFKLLHAGYELNQLQPAQASGFWLSCNFMLIFLTILCWSS